MEDGRRGRLPFRSRNKDEAWSREPRLVAASAGASVGELFADKPPLGWDFGGCVLIFVRQPFEPATSHVPQWAACPVLPARAEPGRPVWGAPQAAPGVQDQEGDTQRLHTNGRDLHAAAGKIPEQQLKGNLITVLGVGGRELNGTSCFQLLRGQE